MIVYSYTVICGDLQNNIAVYVPSTSQHKLCLFWTNIYNWLTYFLTKSKNELNCIYLFCLNQRENKNKNVYIVHIWCSHGVILLWIIFKHIINRMCININFNDTSSAKPKTVKICIKYSKIKTFKKVCVMLINWRHIKVICKSTFLYLT